LRAVFNHAVRKQHARTNLADNLRKRRIADGRKHVQPTPDPLSESATAALWRLLRHSEGVPERFLGVVLLTGLRADEAASLEWRHIRFDWPEPAIVIPPDERKAGVGVELPLTDLLHWYLADAGAQEGTPYVFPSVSASSGHVWRNQPKAQDRLSRQIEGHPAISPQRLRQTVRSGLARLGVEREVAEHVLGHGEGGIGRSYQGDTMYGRKLEALKAWHRRLDELAGIA
jgi:integrase